MKKQLGGSAQMRKANFNFFHKAFWLCLLMIAHTLLHAGNGEFKSLSIINGLAHTDVKSLAQDSVGLIWLGTSDGLQSYDGYSFTTYDYYKIDQQTYQSHNRINTISCSKKTIWVGTESGLTCFDLDTYKYIPYSISENIGKRIQHERISQVNIDSQRDILWIFMDKECLVASIDEATHTLSFLPWENPSDNKNTTSHFVPKYGIMWRLESEHLVRLTVENGMVKSMRIPYKTEIMESKGSTHGLTATKDFLYLRTDDGCHRIALNANQMPNFNKHAYLSFHQIHPDIPAKTSGHFIVDERNGDLWCAYWAGLFHISQPFTENISVKNYFHNTADIQLSKIQITSLLLDQFDNIWVGMNSLGLHYKSLYPLPFYQIAKEKFLRKGYFRNEVIAIKKQEPNILWMIIENSSLFRYNEHTEELSLIPLNTGKDIPTTLQSLYINKDQKFLYIGAVNGLMRYEIATGKILHMIGALSTIVPTEESVTQMSEDKWGKLWVGTWRSGIYCFESPGQHPMSIRNYNSYTDLELTGNQVTDVRMAEHFLLVTTTNGLNKIHMDNKGNVEKIINYQMKPQTANTMSSNYLATVEIENDSTYWVGTIGGGLNQIISHSDIPDDYTAQTYGKQAGLRGNDIEIVYRDEAGDIWMGGNGIFHLDPKTNKIMTYSANDGLQNSSFKMGAGCKSSDGTIYMGGPGGMNFFQPKEFSRRSSTSNLILTGLYINNQLIEPGYKYESKIILDKTINQTHEIVLAYNQNTFSLTCAALGFQLSNHIKYRYHMEGYGKGWNELAYQQNQIYYTNIPYGNYKLEIQVSLDNGETWESPSRTLAIRIVPPIWLRWWAKSFYAILIIGIIGVIVFQYNKEQRLKQEKQIQELLRKKDEEKYQSKMIFFMNLSHELKTPLTLIMLAAERMGSLKDFQDELRLILSNAKKMLQLIIEMVDIRKTDMGINKLNVSKEDMRNLSLQIFNEMVYLAKDKNIEMTYKSLENTLLMDMDLDKIGKMIVNIYSNAIRYTPQYGSIKVELKIGALGQFTPAYKYNHNEGKLAIDQKACLLTVRDSGIGISPESIHHIYERFFQVKGEESGHLGSGLGLAIVKNAVLLHNGTIIVSSERNVGTEILIALPLVQQQKEVKNETSSNLDIKAFIEDQYTDYNPEAKSLPLTNEELCLKQDQPILLIVEDNKEMQAALNAHFLSSYNVYIANNGKEGLALCEKIMPDILISDVMMPEMDGIEMCGHIRNNLSIAYLPIILLTAKNEVEDQIEGYESGADLYISKPFSMKLLDVSVKRLLEKKQLLLSRQDKTNATSPLLETGTPPSTRQSLLDEEKEAFKKHLQQLIEQNLSNPDLSVDFFCQQLFMGKTKLWQRVKECCGESLAEYVRNIRLDKAAHLLRESTLNISEIKDEVGYTNSSHFARSFKQKFGISPTDYAKGK